MQYTIARESTTYIGILVGRAGMLLALAEKGEFQSAEKDEEKRESERRRFYQDKAELFRLDLTKSGLLRADEDPTRMLDQVERLYEFGKHTVNTAYDPLFENLNGWAAFCSRLLIGFIGLLFALPGLLIWSRRSPDSFERTRGIFAIVFAGTYLSLFLGVGSNPNGAGMPLIFTIPVLLMAITLAKTESNRVAMISFVAATCFTTFAMGFFVGTELAGLLLALCGLLWLSVKWHWLASLLALASGAVCVFSLRAPEFSQMGVFVAVPMALAAGCLLFSFPPRWVGHGAACIALILTALYAYAVSRDVADNVILKKFNPGFVSEAPRVRERAGLPRLSREYILPDFLKPS
jgi:hypothetical protein